MFFLIFSDQSVRVAYLGFQTQLYFEPWVFLLLGNVFSYYHKDPQRNQNNVTNGRNNDFCLTRLSLFQVSK